MKTLFILGCAFLSTSVAFTQINPTADEEKAMKTVAVADSGWTRGGTLIINSAATYLNQWAAGGNNAVNLASLVNYNINYKKGNNVWANTFDLAYGLQLLGLGERAIKTDDKIDITSKYGRKASSKWYYAALLNFKTQMAPGFAVGSNGIPLWDLPKISDFLAPAFALGSLGMDYIPNKDLTVFISPITYRGIIVRDDILAAQGAFGVEKGEVGVNDFGELVVLREGQNFRTEIGAYLRVQYLKTIMKNVTWSSRLELYSNYLEDPQNVDLNWQNLISMKTNDWLTTTIFAHWIYDDNTTVFRDFDDATQTPTNPGPGLQSKFVLGLGLSFRL